ncbi:MAG TPA: M20 family metallo-hydrolase [Thermoanaerobacterales bacterium]|nr:M20 family metallo-hydrolase [Thermoanaerobacterales bacterium]
MKINDIKKDIETLAKYTSTPSSGVTRLPFTPEDKKAKEYIKRVMKEIGLKVMEDGVGTIFGKYKGLVHDASAILIGSHYDTVKNGGAFDGVAGIAAALEVIRVLNRENIKTKHPIEIVAMNDEEGVRFEGGMLSSRAIVGDILEEELDTSKDENGISIREAMKDFGIEPNLATAKREKNSIKAFLELHIEQGPILESKGKDIGIVENIVGLDIYKVIINGKPGHAGTTPMNMRADALLAASKAILKLNSIIKESDSDLVGTVGELIVLPGTANVIPGIVEFTIDIRSCKKKRIKEIMVKFEEILKEIEYDVGVKSSISKVFSLSPVKLSKEIIGLIEKEVSLLGYENLFMISGAGHDAMVMAEHVPTGMIFVPSKDGISHTPDEWTDYEQIRKGVEVLVNTIISIDND